MRVSIEPECRPDIQSEQTVITGEIMKRRLPAGVLVMAFSMFLYTGSASAQAHEFSVVSAKEDAKVRSDDCLGSVEMVEVGGFGQRDACFTAGQTLVGSVSTPSGVRLVAQEPWSSMYLLVNGVCESGLSCQYAGTTDQLVERHYGPRGYPVVSIHQTFLEQLQPEVTSDGPRYAFQRSVEPWTLSDVRGDMLHVGSAAFSQNGQWMVAELINKGVVRIDTRALSLSRVFAPGYQYGRGMDPRHHLAVSNDGRHIVITGFNGGLNIVTISDGCGEEVPFPLSDYPLVSGPMCPVFASVQVPVASIRYFHHPVFTDDGTQLLLRAGTTTGQEYRLLLQSDQRQPIESIELLAMGDSFTSGEGETDDRQYRAFTNTQRERCHLSQRSYPYVLAQLSDWVRLVSVACSGARIGDIQGIAEYNGQSNRLTALSSDTSSIEQLQLDALTLSIPGRVPQAAFLAPLNPKRILLGVGGNDAGITAKLSDCAGPGTCRWAHAAYRQATFDEMNRLITPLTSLYRHISDWAPSSQLAVTGYPVALKPDGQCDPLTTTLFSKEERHYMKASIQLLNRVIETAARAADVQFAPLEDVFQGHSLCESTSTPAMNGARFGKEAGIIESLPTLNFIGSESFHPTPFGHELIAKRLYTSNVFGGECVEGACEASEKDDDYWRVTPNDNGPRYIRNIPMQRERNKSVLRVVIPASLRLNSDSLSVKINQMSTSITDVTRAHKDLVMTIDVPDIYKMGGYSVSIEGASELNQAVELYDWIPAVEPPETQQTIEASDVSQRSRRASAGTLASIASSPTIRPQTVLGQTEALSAEPISAAETLVSFSEMGKNLVSYTWVLVVMGIMAVWLLFVLLLRK